MCLWILTKELLDPFTSKRSPKVDWAMYVLRGFCKVVRKQDHES